jgi:predicted regulator of Ras-like GTPase activity (Roadblock/LC7/MglB family)
MALVTVTLPGGNGNFTNLAVEKDAKATLTSAIKNLFNENKPNITPNEIASGVDGTKGFFNLVLDGALASTTITAGANVQALFDTGLGKDTLLGNNATTLFFANNDGDSISSTAAASTIIGGTGSDTVSAQGNISAYLEAGSNQVNLSSGSVSLLGTGGNDTVNVVAGSNTVTADYKATIDLSGNNTKDKLALANGSTVSITGSNVVTTITGNNETIYINGSNESISLVGSGDKVIFVGGSNDTVTYSSPGKGNGKGHHSATVIGGGDDHGNGKGHSVAGSGTSTIHGGKAVFTHVAGEHNVFTASQHAETMAGALHDTVGGTDLFKLDAAAHSHHTITAFSSQSDTISIAHLTARQLKVGFAHATITGGGAHTTTILTADHTKITIIGDRVLRSDLKPDN